MPTRDEVLTQDAVILQELQNRTPKEVAATLKIPLGRVYAARRRKPDVASAGRPRSPSDRNREIARMYEAGARVDAINEALNLNLTRQRIHQIARRVKEVEGTTP